MKLLRLLTILLFCCSFLLTAPGSVMAGDPPGAGMSPAVDAQGHPAFALNGKPAFEENKGQVTGADAGLVRYRLRTGNLTIFLMETGIAYQFEKITVQDPYKGDAKPGTIKNKRSAEDAPARSGIETYRMDIQLVDANKRAQIIAEGRSPGFVNYYNHNALQVYSYDKITYKDIYPGVDWVVFTTTDDKAGGRQGLKYEFVVHPGADPSMIQLKTRWAEGSLVDKDGNLVLKNRMGEIREKTPVSFQRSRRVGTAFSLDHDLVRFKLDAYDPAEQLIIDPALGWATYFGGSSYDECFGSAVDASGNIYIAGRTESSNSIASGGHQTTHGGGGPDAFLAKFSPTGVRLWATYYGGDGRDGGTGCSVDASGNVYLTGWTTSTSGIADNGMQIFFEGDYDAFLVKFNSAGARQWATYIGGSGNDQALACVNDPSGNVYLCGSTTSSYNIAFNGFKNTLNVGRDAFLVKFDTDGARLWGTYYGGTDDEAGYGCNTDASGNVFLLGNTTSAFNIASGGFQNSFGGLVDGFMVKFNSAGARQWATYIGAGGQDYIDDCTIDNSNNIYVCGQTNSTAGIASGGHQMTHKGDYDGLLVKYDPNGARLWATYYGGSDYDRATVCFTDASGNVYLVGDTDSPDNIASNGFQNNLTGGADAYLVQFDPSGVRQWASYAGGNDLDYGNTSVRDHSGNIYIAGATTSTDLASGGHQNTYGGGTYDGFIMKIVACAPFAITADPLIQAACSGKSINPITPASSEPAAVFSWTRDHTAEATGIPASGSGTISGTLTNTTDAPVTVTFTITATTDDCSSLPLTVQVTVYPDLSGDLQADVTDPACFGQQGEIALSSQSGNETYTYAWNTGETTASVQAAAGAYTVTVTPGNGCSFVRTFTLTQPDEIQVSVTNNNGTLSASATGGTGELTFAWSTGATTPTITATQLGDYTVTVTDENGCRQTATISVTTLATGGLSGPEWKVFPNPTTGLVKIDIDKTEKQALIQVTDVTGKACHIDAIRDGAVYLLDMTALPPGVYVISLKSSNQVWSKRVIKIL